MSRIYPRRLSAVQAWHLFVLGGLAAATAAVLLLDGTTPSNVILTCLAIGAACVTGLALHRTLSPLAAGGVEGATELTGGRARAALEREKTLVLRSIKEVEFDHAMGKVSDADCHEMIGRLRQRALGLIKQLDRDQAGYRELIERELGARLGGPRR